MKKNMVAMILALGLLCSVSVSAFATEEARNYSTENQETVESTHSPMTRDAKTTLQTVTLKAGVKGYASGTQYTGTPFYGSNIPKGVLFYVTNLSTTGSKTTVPMGLALYDSINGMFYQEVGAKLLVNMSMKDSSYAYPNLSSNKKYYPYLNNNTGGGLSGTATWYRVDSLS